MIQLKSQYPYNNNDKLICHYAEDENGQKFQIKQIETNLIYALAVDVYPCRYSYEITNIKIDEVL